MVQKSLFGNHNLDDIKFEGEELALKGNTYAGI
jgi:hypothetical protein